MLTCRDFIEFLSDYLEDNLPSDERAVFDEHLAVCPACVAYLNTYRDTIRLSRETWSEFHGDSWENAPEDLVQAILAARRAAGAE